MTTRLTLEPNEVGLVFLDGLGWIGTCCLLGQAITYMTNLIEQIPGDLSGSIDAILNHPYLYALEKKQVSRVKLEIFVCEQYYIIESGA